MSVPQEQVEAQAQPQAQAQAQGQENAVHVNLNLGLNVYRLGGRHYPAEATVATGLVAVAFHNWDVHDYQGLTEVYLTGEVVRPNRLRRGSECLVVEMGRHVGTIVLALRRRIVGISPADTDYALANIRFDMRVENPLKLLEERRNIETTEGRNQVSTEIVQWVQDELAAVVGPNGTEALWFWSFPDFREVSDSLFSRLDRLLAGRGLRMVAGPTSYRRWPAALREIVLEFRATEQELLTEEGADLAQLGMVPGELIEVRRICETQGRGSGLFTMIRRRHEARRDIGAFVEWLDEPTQLAHAAAELLRALYGPTGNVPGQERSESELAEQVLLAAFRRQELGLEWGETEPRRVTAS